MEQDEIIINVISDVHTEFGVSPTQFENILVKADITVLAGDISSRASTISPYLRVCKKFSKHVIFVCGNHEYYKGSIDDDYQRVCDAEDVVFLQRKRVCVDGLWFAGATLWTKITEDAKKLLNDNFSAKKINSLHEIDEEWLLQNVQPDDIVVTHHLPSFQLIHEKYADHPASSAFASDLDDMIERLKPRLWICGHTHMPFDTFVRGVRVVINPVGYPKENESFTPKMITYKNDVSFKLEKES
jgi:Icc-related predicted phosphoesterase